MYFVLREIFLTLSTRSSTVRQQGEISRALRFRKFNFYVIGCLWTCNKIFYVPYFMVTVSTRNLDAVRSKFPPVRIL